jgi:hypothetical protein
MENQSLILDSPSKLEEFIQLLWSKAPSYLAPFTEWDNDELTERMDSISPGELDRLDEK